MKLSRILIAFVILAFIIAAGRYYFKWRIAAKYDDTITVRALFMQYACGDCSVDMRVETVDNEKYKFILHKDIFPTSERKSFDSLCDYISNETFKYQQKTGYTTGFFTLVGRLHKYPHELWGCSQTPYFTVEKIKFNDGDWVKF